MRAGGGKQKGARFEREVCRRLSLWVTDGTRDDVFWRSAMSGGRATIGLNTGNVRAAQAGDVSMVHQAGARLLDYVVVECKSYRDLSLFSGIVNDTGSLCRFWNELKAQAAKYQKRPLLIARQNGLPAICLLEPATAAAFGLEADHASATITRWGCVLVLFDCFLREARLPDGQMVLLPRPRRILLTGSA